MTKWIAIAMLLAVPAAAQESEQNQEKAREWAMATEVVKLNYAEAASVRQALEAFQVEMRYDPTLQIISIRGEEKTVAEVVANIKEIDVPAAAIRNVELTFHVLLASRSPDDGETLPESLKPVAAQLDKVLGFPSARLLESVMVRVRDRNDGSANGLLGGVGEAPVLYQLSFRRVGVSGQAGEPSVRMDDLFFTAKVKPDGEASFWDVGMKTDLDVKSGQKAVVGTAGVDVHGRSIILVVTARVV